MGGRWEAEEKEKRMKKMWDGSKESGDVKGMGWLDFQSKCVNRI